MSVGVAALGEQQTADQQAGVPVQSSAGTRVALGLPALGLALLTFWVVGSHGTAPSPWALIALPAICAGYGLFPLVLGPRTWVTFEDATVLLAGLVGGPIAGVVAGVATGLGDVRAVWRRRSAYAGLTMIYGFVAGVFGDAWRSGAITLAVAAVATCLGYLAVYSVGWVLILLDRQRYRPDWPVRVLVLDAAGIVGVLPLVVLFAGNFASKPILVCVAVASLLAVVTCAVWAITREREFTQRERDARHRDPLTGALTRVVFDDALAREHARVLRGDHTSGLIVIDLDHFARFNERYGHLGGDAALRFVVEQITRATRASDVVARWGGEELCVIVPDIGSLKELEALCERIRGAVAGTVFTAVAEQATITISLGATVLTESHTPEETFARADEALYRAKHTRNTSCILEPSPRPQHAHHAPQPARS